MCSIPLFTSCVHVWWIKVVPQDWNLSDRMIKSLLGSHCSTTPMLVLLSCDNNYMYCLCNIIVCPSNWLTNVCITQHTPAGVAELVILTDDQLIHSLTLSPSFTLCHTVLCLFQFFDSLIAEKAMELCIHTTRSTPCTCVIGVRITKVKLPYIANSLTLFSLLSSM